MKGKQDAAQTPPAQSSKELTLTKQANRINSDKTGKRKRGGYQTWGAWTTTYSENPHNI
jgi:hypothetical protein